MTDTIDVLFTGHAPVHYACFRPLADRLRELPGVRVFVAGGLKSTEGDQVRIIEHRPLSKRKRWKVEETLVKATLA